MLSASNHSSGVSPSILNRFSSIFSNTVTVVPHPVTLSCNSDSMFEFLIKHFTNIFLLHESQTALYSSENTETLQLQVALIH